MAGLSNQTRHFSANLNRGFRGARGSALGRLAFAGAGHYAYGFGLEAIIYA